MSKTTVAAAAHWLRFSLRTLLVVTAICCIVVAQHVGTSESGCHEIKPTVPGGSTYYVMYGDPTTWGLPTQAVALADAAILGALVVWRRKETRRP